MRRLFPALVAMALWLFVPAGLRAEEKGGVNQIRFCVTSLGLYQVDEAELVSGLVEMIKKLGFSAEGKAGSCEVGGDLWLEINLMRVGDQITVNIVRKESGNKATCEKNRTEESLTQKELLEKFKEDLSACLPTPPAAKKTEARAPQPEKKEETVSTPLSPPLIRTEPVVEKEKPLAAPVSTESSTEPIDVLAAKGAAVSVPARARWGKGIFWSGLGLSAAGAAAMIFAEKEYRDIKRDLSGSKGTVVTFGGLGIGALSLGLAGAALGLGLWLWPSGGDRPVSVSPAITPEGGALVLSTGW